MSCSLNINIIYLHVTERAFISMLHYSIPIDGFEQKLGTHVPQDPEEILCDIESPPSISIPKKWMKRRM